MPTAMLINPWIYDFSAYDLWMRPIGLLRVASYLRKQGFKVVFFDCLKSRASKIYTIEKIRGLRELARVKNNSISNTN